MWVCVFVCVSLWIHTLKANIRKLDTDIMYTVLQISCTVLQIYEYGVTDIMISVNVNIYWKTSTGLIHLILEDKFSYNISNSVTPSEVKFVHNNHFTYYFNRYTL